MRRIAVRVRRIFEGSRPRRLPVRAGWGRTVAELAEVFEVPRQTVYRVLEHTRAAETKNGEAITA
ncbi:hypothetical protein [Salinispora tropica]|uniref:hypothetical protein n=1 Tax=Salinispora tropica TaxID=168695 RepID=UPI0018AFB35C|nr:hypothetical protein [Salinispora tropica]